MSLVGPDAVTQVLRRGHSTCLTLAAKKISSICENIFLYFKVPTLHRASLAIPLRSFQNESPRKWRARCTSWRRVGESTTTDGVTHALPLYERLLLRDGRPRNSHLFDLGSRSKGASQTTWGLRQASRGSDGLCCCFDVSWLVQTLPRHENGRQRALATSERPARPLSVFTRTQSTSTGGNS